ncbi:hypothetical protein [Halobellus clavatus]|uniref:Uncharacterized protein n=1 Tax=Halobellus clavatus TaxID=660517 RepID=A0A1H3GL35_9EURY|nr:hypothetical protein [Halobellus clavatus]SDY03807.1 hypothetical protein SAMN04487946_105226 [Halobellus clavatus]
MSKPLDISLRRREYLTTATAVSGTLAIAGCIGSNGSGLELINTRQSGYQSDGYSNWYFEVENTGDTQNVRAYVDLVHTTGENEGEVFESYDRTKIIMGGETAEIKVVSALYLDSTIDQFDYGIEPTDRPHATFEVTSMGPEVSADASGSTSVENSVTSYEWSAHQYEQPEYGESLNWDVSGGETVEFEWGDSDEYLADLVLKVTDEEGRTDDSNRRVRIE